MAVNTCTACWTGTATSTRSAPSSAARASAAISSMTPSSNARVRLARPRPTPTTRSTHPACFSAAAKEPPISPTPKMASLPKQMGDTGLGRKGGREGGEEALVFGLKPGGPAKMPGQPEPPEGWKNDPRREKALIPPPRRTGMEGYEVAEGG